MSKTKIGKIIEILSITIILPYLVVLVAFVMVSATRAVIEHWYLGKPIPPQRFISFTESSPGSFPDPTIPEGYFRGLDGRVVINPFTYGDPLKAGGSNVGK